MSNQKRMKEEIQLAELPEYVGRQIGTSDWVTLTQEHIDGFARVSGDDQWIHVDVERATRELGAPVAHGLLTLSLLPMLALRAPFRIGGVSRRVNYGFDRVRFTASVQAGANIRLHQTLKAVEAKAGGLAATRHCVIEIEGRSKPAMVADWITVLYGEA